MGEARTTWPAGGAPLLALALAGAAALATLPRGDACGATPAPCEGGEAKLPAPSYSFAARDVVWAVEPVREEVAREATPGAAVAVGVRGEEVHLVGIGMVGWTRNAAAVDPRETVYDLASLTKVVATASAVMLLAEEGRMALDEPVARHLPAFTGEGRDRVTVRHLLTHTSGLPPGGRLGSGSREQRIARLLKTPLYFSPGTQRDYSDAGYMVLWEAAERAAGEPLPRYLERRLFGPLRMSRTGFAPGLDCERCAPTSRLRSQDLYRGKPFDPAAQKLDGVTGSAGLFSSARDLGVFAAMIAGGGAVGGVRVMSEASVREFTRLPRHPDDPMLGWATSCAGSQPAACEAPDVFGHNGWTGTSLWIDPRSGVWAVLLTNRTYEPRAESRLQDVRRALFERVIAHVDGAPLLAGR